MGDQASLFGGQESIEKFWMSLYLAVVRMGSWSLPIPNWLSGYPPYLFSTLGVVMMFEVVC